MNIFSIDSEGYITEIKTVLKHYVMNDNDVEGIPQFKVGQHYQTGLDKPKTQEQLNNERINELKTIIPEKQLCALDVTEEQTELKTLLGY